MTVRDVMAPARGVVREEDSLVDVARRMVECHSRVVPVLDDANGVKGLLVHADIVESIARGDDPAGTSAGRVAGPVATVDADAALDEAANILRDQSIGLVPAVDGDGLAGLVSRYDVEAHSMLLDELGPDAVARIFETLPEDPGLRRRRGAYLRAGLSALQSMRRALGEAGRSEVESVLDFACGHGRILRVLEAALPSVRFAACDLDKEGVDYCAREFGATPIYSSEDPAEVHIDQEFDLIWSGSLFTHIDGGRWPGFLELLETSLAPGGVLVFTTLGLRDPKRLEKHGLTETQVEGVLSALEKVGFGYAQYHPGANWGLTIVSPEWVQSQVEKRDGLRLLSYAEKAWDAPSPQDVVSCVRA